MSLQSALKQPLLWLWIATLASLPVSMAFVSPGWDAAVYRRAMHAVVAGHDPYAEDISVEISAHLAAYATPDVDLPFSYVYPPATLPLLRLLGTLPPRATVTACWFLYAAAVFYQLWAAVQFVQAAERKWFLFLVPIAPFFPGLFSSGILFSGNVAYLLYAAILLTATSGWRRNRWFWFYVAVFVAACFKPPYLTLVVIAPLSAHRQWRPAGVTAIVATAAFAAQAFFWSRLFRHYLQAVELIFRYRRDFGCSPAGLLSDLLSRHNTLHAPAAFILYLCYALPLLALLIHLARAYLGGLFSAQEWLPVLLIGVGLLNPRLIEYDVAPLALPLALIAWRIAAQHAAHLPVRWIIAAFLAWNAIALSSWSTHKLLEGLLLVALFSAASWRLCKLIASQHPKHSASGEYTALPAVWNHTPAKTYQSQPVGLGRDAAALLCDDTGEYVS